MSVTVAEEGNRRTGDMTSAEAAQCTFDIKAWFARTPCAKLFQQPASSVDFQRLEKTIDTPMPSTLKLLLNEVGNGGIYFMDRKLMSTDEIGDCVSSFDREQNWKRGLIPFAGDGETLYVIDTTRGEEVYEWDAADGLADLVSPNLCRFLEDYRNNLLSGRFEYLEDIGVVEKMGGGGAPAPQASRK